MANQPRAISEIAAEIDRIWSQQGKGVHYAARPYLDAMKTLSRISQGHRCYDEGYCYRDDTAASVVRYFLANAQSFRGEDAKRLNAELRALL